MLRVKVEISCCQKNTVWTPKRILVRNMFLFFIGNFSSLWQGTNLDLAMEYRFCFKRMCAIALLIHVEVFMDSNDCMHVDFAVVSTCRRVCIG